MLVVAITLDTIWFTRNKLTHEGKKPNVRQAIRTIHNRYSADLTAGTPNGQIRSLSWVPLSVGEFKINFDVAIKENWMYAAAIYCDHQGRIQKIRLHNWLGSSPLKGEARVARLAVALVEDFADSILQLEGDAQGLVQQITDCSLTPDWLIEGEVHTLRNLLRDHCRWSIQWIPREGNALAHNLAQWGSINVFQGDFYASDVP